LDKVILRPHPTLSEWNKNVYFQQLNNRQLSPPGRIIAGLNQTSCLENVKQVAFWRTFS
jgi:hypothetical protein